MYMNVLIIAAMMRLTARMSVRVRRSGSWRALLRTTTTNRPDAVERVTLLYMHSTRVLYVECTHENNEELRAVKYSTIRADD